MMRQSWICKGAGTGVHGGLALSRQCTLAGVSRATLYARTNPKRVKPNERLGDELLKRLIDEEYTRTPSTVAARWWCTWVGAGTALTANGHAA
jgi:hypothetical protein